MPKPRTDARVDLRVTSRDKAAFSRAQERDGDATLTSWITRQLRLAARTAVDTMRSVAVSALVKG